ncbi:unnamed protein product [Lymnaea stagnalis]|uniref:Geminin n=1 Tax=Lymnaea stagnalis TaxID=6523 RepID=A0AAV2IJ45_LYMST
MDTVLGSENSLTSTPKVKDNVTLNISFARHERKTLQTIQHTASDPNYGGQTLASQLKGSKELKLKTKLYYNEPSTHSSPHSVHIYKDSIMPENSAIVHCHRNTQTDISLLEDLIQKHLQGEVGDPDDSGRLSAYIDQDTLDLVTKGEVSESYWKDLAEERRRALIETMAENEKLTAEVDQLREENRRLSVIASQAESLKEMLEGIISDDEETTEAASKYVDNQEISVVSPGAGEATSEIHSTERNVNDEKLD